MYVFRYIRVRVYTYVLYEWHMRVFFKRKLLDTGGSVKANTPDSAKSGHLFIEPASAVCATQTAPAPPRFPGTSPTDRIVWPIRRSPEEGRSAFSAFSLPEVSPQLEASLSLFCKQHGLPASPLPHPRDTAANKTEKSLAWRDFVWGAV